MENTQDAKPRSKTLPPTPSLPDTMFWGRARVNGCQLWYALYGPPLTCGRTPVVFLHGGKISSRWWGIQIRHLVERGYPVVAMDTRGHGRSTDDAGRPFSYELFADDVVALLEHLDVAAAHVVGWSDGANTSLSLAMRYSAKVKRIFAFGANYQPDQANPYVVDRVPFLSDLMSRMRDEYQSISSTPEDFDAFKAKVTAMQASHPAWTAEDFSRITTSRHDSSEGPLVWIVTGDSEELIRPEVSNEITAMIPGSTLVVLPGVGHFAPLQDAKWFNNALDEWLIDRP